MKDETFSKKERLLRRTDFLRVQRRGHKFHTENFLIFALKTCAQARVGFTVSKKVGNAVVRNRVKRLLREAYRTHKTLFPTGLNVVFVAKKDTNNIKLDTLLKDVQRFLYFARTINTVGEHVTRRPAGK